MNGFRICSYTVHNCQAMNEVGAHFQPSANSRGSAVRITLLGISSIWSKSDFDMPHPQCETWSCL